MQLVATLVIVGLAAAYVGRSMWKAWTGRKTGCGSGCGTCAVPKPPAAPAPNGRISLPQI